MLTAPKAEELESVMSEVFTEVTRDGPTLEHHAGECGCWSCVFGREIDHNPVWIRYVARLISSTPMFVVNCLLGNGEVIGAVKGIACSAIVLGMVLGRREMAGATWRVDAAAAAEEEEEQPADEVEQPW